MPTSYITQYKVHYKNKRTQFVIFDLQGNLIESCDTLVDFSHYKNVSMYDINPFLESIKDVLHTLVNIPNKINSPLSYPRLEIPLLTREGVFDYTFEVFIAPQITEEKYIIWIIEDNTDLYQYLWKVQQERNETAIRKELLIIQTQKIIHLHRVIYEKTAETHEKTYLLDQQLQYAERIQKGLLLDIEKHKQPIPQHFVVFFPKEQASGDFYWVNHFLDPQNNSLSLIALMDCTGFGVTGAFLSISITYLLREIVEIDRIYQPQNVLQELDKRFTILFNTNTIDYDAIQMALCCLDKQNQQLTFAGAKRGVLFIQNQQMQYLVGSSYSIGGLPFPEKIFEETVLPLQDISHFYLFTDGYADQFGGENNQKLTIKAMKELLLQIYTLPLEEQKQMLTQNFLDWKGTNEQTDDMLIIGVAL